MGSPGPATVSLVATGSAYGRQRSLPYLIGIIAGTTIVLLAVATGITAALLAIPAIAAALTVVAVVYILVLAYQIATAPPLKEQIAATHAPSLAGGMLLGMANPKAWIAIAAVFASTRLADVATLDAASKIGLLTVMIVLICGTWLVAGTSLAPLLRDPRRARVVNVGLAISVIVATAFLVAGDRIQARPLGG